MQIKVFFMTKRRLCTYRRICVVVSAYIHKKITIIFLTAKKPVCYSNPYKTYLIYMDYYNLGGTYEKGERQNLVHRYWRTRSGGCNNSACHLSFRGNGGVGMHRMAMACERACFAETLVGAAIAAIAVASLFIKNEKFSVASSAALLVGGVAAIATPSIIGLCESEAMACRYITAPTLTILGSAIIVLSIIRFTTGIIAIRRASAAV
jgi:hypothetical protein